MDISLPAIIRVAIAIELLWFSPSAMCQVPPLSAHDLNVAGVKLQSEGKLPQAAEQYRQAIKLQPNGAAYHNNLALVLKDLDQLSAAEQEARTALKLKPKRSDYHYNLAIILQKENKMEEAEVEYKQASELDPMDTECHYRLAQVMSQLSRLPEAEDQLKLALMLKPNEYAYHMLYGDMLMKTGKREEDALNEYRKAAELSPNSQVSTDLKNKLDYLRQVLKTR